MLILLIEVWIKKKLYHYAQLAMHQMGMEVFSIPEVAAV